jgi:hypothetical protein
MNLETRLQRMRSNGQAFKLEDKSGKQEHGNPSDVFHGFVASRFFPLFLLS